MAVYHLQRGEKDEKLNAFPEGFRMLAGDPFKRNFTSGPDAKAINFASFGANKPETNGIPNYNCPGGLRTQILHNADKFKDEWNGNQHPFVLSNGDTTGYGFHGDFVHGWDVNVPQNAVNTCLDDSGSVAKCSTVTMYTGDKCKVCKLPPVVNEVTDGWLKELPGCNPVPGGPERAKPVTDCAKAELSAPAANYVDLATTKIWASNNDMTVEKCVDFCSDAGFTYACLEYGREYYCGNQLNPAKAPREGMMGSCTMKCCEGTRKNNQIGGGNGGAAPSPPTMAVSSRPVSSTAPV
ncbi:hypothetical protein K469DRAFT_740577 [Zopfia rhizophila CBS 207.26]|uniref:WSC domain-containing protein n=1 Tax=Zopfia rhizophila CBS 207.26 TaxID=1314779 RepID=A0A6A6DTF5_9PEZI|nr:hypothetical protein K469DRAFT_740577 [Zopfia rhizophila CBS 207.26]